jgi:hypothetical protein
MAMFGMRPKKGIVSTVTTKNPDPLVRQLVEALLNIRRSAELHKNGVSMPGTSAHDIYDAINNALTTAREAGYGS